MAIRAVKVRNVSLGASEHDIKEFFSFSGEIEHIELQSDNERSQIAYVSFKEPQEAETAVLLSGATIVDQSVTIDLDPDYNPPATDSTTHAAENQSVGQVESAVWKAEDVVTTMLARGFILGKDALNKAKAFDEKHQFALTASARVSSLDQKIGFSEKISAGTTMVNEKAREMDEKYQVSEKTKTAFNNAGSAIMKNRYVLTGATWVTGAFNRVAKAASDVGQKTKEKVMAEEEKAIQSMGYSRIDESESAKAANTDHTSQTFHLHKA